MKLINKANNTTEKIISTDDIIMTNQELGTSLTDVLDEQQENINDLKSNVKWLYKYGGVGGKYGSGGGGSSSSKYTVIATLDDVKIGPNMILKDNIKQHKIKVEISKPGGKTYLLNYTVGGKSNTKTIYLSQETNNYEYSFDINPTTNGDILIRVYDEDRVLTTINGNYILNPYTLYCQVENKNGINVLNDTNELFIGNIKSEGGLYYSLNYEFAISPEYVDYEIHIQGENNDAINEVIINNENILSSRINIDEQKRGSIKINLNELLNDIYSGQYSISCAIKIKEQNKFEEIIDLPNCIFYLIPNDLYAIIKTSKNDILYNSYDNNWENKVFLEEGLKTLLITPYNGSNIINTININIDIYKITESNGENEFINSQELLNVKARSINKISINFSTNNNYDVYYLKFTLTVEGSLESKYIDKYVYIKKSEYTLNWYSVNIPGAQSNEPNSSIYYKMNSVGANGINYDINYQNLNLYKLYNNKSCIDIYSNLKNPISLFENNNSKYISLTNSSFSKFLNFGIQYNVINDDYTDDNNIINISLSSINTNNFIKIWQNKIYISFGSVKEEIEIFIPKEEEFDKNDASKYHLLTLAFRNINNTDNSIEVVCYIDGIIEQACSQLFNKEILSNDISIELRKGNYALNLFELCYYSTDRSISMSDADISNYYYVYNKLYNENLTTNIQPELLAITKQFIMTNINGYDMIKFGDEGDVNILTKYSNVPVMILSYNVETVRLNTSNDFDFATWFLTSYQESTNTENEQLQPIDYQVPVTVSYCYKQDNWQNGIVYNGSNECNFYIKIQGSSTKAYAVKNLTLAINETGLNNEVFVYSPNFKKHNELVNEANEGLININDIKSIKHELFLPEREFTLKADITDSTHCNNTSIGKFVNKNTTQFSDAINDINTNYQDYIKNCLMGFPVLIVFHEIKNDNSDEYYYGGIYNFNLGRNSDFNLGYMKIKLNNNDIWGDNLNGDSNFKVYTISTEHSLSEESDYTKKEKLCVAEIQGNEALFDFSQFNETVLFAQETGGKSNMHMYDDIVSGSDNFDLIKNSIINFNKGVAYLGGYIFDYIGKNFRTTGPTPRYYIDDEIEKYGYGYDEGYTAYNHNKTKYDSINQVPNFQFQLKQTLDSSGNSIFTAEQLNIGKTNDGNSQYLGNSDFQWNNDAYNFVCDFYRGKRKIDTEDVSYNKPGIDITSLVEYYVICMAFALTDSVQKNLNIKTWNLGNNNDSNSNDQDTYYIAFYDMDTALGRDNKGGSIDYFVFSDYYYANSTIQNNLITSQIKTIYRDFFPKKEANDVIHGFDTPSSYLFAIAKYHAMLTRQNIDIFAFNDNSNDRKNNYKLLHPLEIWAKFRKENGELRNAQYFIDNYFANNIKKIDPVLVSYNYRFKYLRSENSNLIRFNTYNLTPLRGTGISYVKNWLNGRLHILDTYYNVICENSPIMKYNINEDNWTQVQYVNNTNTIGLNDIAEYTGNSLTNNDDVIILRSMFATDKNVQGSPFTSRTINGIINAPYLTSTIIKSAESSDVIQYLFINNMPIKMTYITSGNVPLIFYGSVMWTNVNDLSDFISDTKKLIINSNYLQNIIFNKDNSICTELTLNNISSVKSIEIHSPGHKYTLAFNDINKCQNLDKIDISGSSIHISELNSINVSDVNLSNIKLNIDTQDIKILNCNNLSNVLLSNLECHLLQISPVWSNNIIINGLKCKKISLLNNKFNTCNIEISGNTELEEVELIGFSSISLSDCPILSKLTIKETNEVKLTSLSVVKCNNHNVQLEEGEQYYPWTLIFNDNICSNFDTAPNVNQRNKSGVNIEAENNAIFDLRCFSQLNSIHFGGGNKNNSTKGFWAIIINQNITLRTNAFTNTTLKRIIQENDSVMNIIGDSVFNNTSYNTSYYTSDTDDRTTFNAFEISTNSLKDMFSVTDSTGAMTLQHYNNFINSIKDDVKSNIISLENAFKGQHIIYTKEILDRNINNSGGEYIASLAKFTNVSNIKNLFGGTGVTCIPYFLFNDDISGNYIGKYVDTISIDNFFNAGSGQNVSYIQSNVFDNIISKIKSIIFESSSLQLFDISGQTTINNNINVLFNRGKDINITIINGLNFGGEGDYTDLFKNFPGKLDTDDTRTLSIINSFNTGSHTNINEIYLFNKKISEIRNSFNFILGENDKVIINTFFNWQYLVANSAKIDFLSSNIDNQSFTLSKCIYDTENNNGWSNLWEILKGASYLNNIFYNTVLYTDVNTAYYELYPFKRDTQDTNANIIITKQLFENFKAYKLNSNNEIGNELPIKLTQNTFKKLSGITTYTDMFKNCTLYCNLPINLFNKAQNIHTDSIDDEVKFGINDNSDPDWSNISASVNRGNYTKYTNYTKNIVDLSGMFYNVRISGGNTYFEYDVDNDIISSSLITINDITDILKYRYNRIKIGNNDSEELPEYYQDMFGLYGDHNDLPVNLSNTHSYNIPLKNNECIYHLFTAPDLLYGCNEGGCNFTSMFENSDFEGIMPNHFMSQIKGNNNFTNMLKQITIIPNYCNTYDFVCPVKDEVNNGTKYGIMKNNIFVYIPQNFNTNIDTCDKLFNFNLLIPENDDINSMSESYNTYYIMYSNSIPNVTTLISLPDISTNTKQLSINSYDFTDNVGNKNASNVISHDITSNIKVHLGTVFDKDKLEKYINSDNSGDNIKDKYMISYNSKLRLNFDNIFDYEGFSKNENNGNNGFKIFDNYQGSILINSTMAQYLYGYIISPKTIIKSGYKITLITTGGLSNSELYKDLSCYALFNDNNSSAIDQPDYESGLYDSNQIFRNGYYYFQNILGSATNGKPTIVNPWQGLKYYTTDKNSHIHALETWNNKTEEGGPTEAEKELKCALDYSQILKFEQVINIPFNPNIMNDPNSENVDNSKYTFIYNISNDTNNDSTDINP